MFVYQIAFPGDMDVGSQASEQTHHWGEIKNPATLHEQVLPQDISPLGLLIEIELLLILPNLSKTSSQKRLFYGELTFPLSLSDIP